MTSDAAPVPSRRRRWLKRFAILFALLVAYIGFIAARLFLFQPELEVGPETTVVEGPLRPDGTIDYVAALNDEWSQGVTPENNAAVPLMEAFGPSAINPAIRDEFFDRLGIEALSEEDDYLVPIGVFLTEQDVDEDRQKELFDVVGGAAVPSIETDYPELAAWIERNTPAIERIVEAARRDKFYMPVLTAPPATTLISIDLATIQQCREAGRLLSSAVALNLQQGDVDAACDKAIACHRLGRHVSGHPTMIGYLVGMAIESVATSASEAILLSGQLTPDTAKRFRGEVASLPPLADVAEMIDRGERLVSLDAVLDIAKRSGGTALPSAIPGRLTKGLDANVMLRSVNTFYDETVDAMRLTNYVTRRDRLDELEGEYLSAKARPTAGMFARALVFGSRTALTKQVSKVLLGLLTPAFSAAQVAEDRTVMKSQLLKVACALAEYRAVEGAYPETLEVLQPKYLDKIPTDFYADAPLNYERIGEAFLLYSVGENRKDDGGLTFGEGESNKCDDLRFGVAPAETPAAD